MTIDQPSVAYMHQGQEKQINCILHGLFSNNPTAKWTGTDSKSASKEITEGVKGSFSSQEYEIRGASGKSRNEPPLLSLLRGRRGGGGAFLGGGVHTPHYE